jgi:hypothetical protein
MSKEIQKMKLPLSPFMKGKGHTQKWALADGKIVCGSV